MERLGEDLEQALEEIDVPVGVADRSGVMLWENKRARELFGDARGRRLYDLIAPDARQAAQIERSNVLLGRKPMVDFSTVRLTTSGERVPVEVHLVGLRNGGRVVGLFGIVHPESPTAPAVRAGPPTPRQLQVRGELSRGASTDQIAEKLELSRTTVRNHINNRF